MTERDVEALATWEANESGGMRVTFRRCSEPPARCYECGGELPNGPQAHRCEGRRTEPKDKPCR